MRNINILDIELGNKKNFVVFAGPCVIEDIDSTIEIAHTLKELSKELKFSLIFKSSYDKANRTSLNSFRGPGLIEGLNVLQKIKKETELPVISDVHAVDEVDIAAKVLDVIQIPAFLSRQTDILIAAAKSGKVVNLKKAQFMAPYDIKYAVNKIKSQGNENIILTERGTCFGYNNLVSDMRSITIMRALGYPIVFDATHSVQIPSLGGKSGVKVNLLKHWLFHQ